MSGRTVSRRIAAVSAAAAK